MARVSVIVPAYNAAGVLENALRSALSQTESDLEVIVVDDASSDSTVEVARMVSARDARLRLLCNQENLGPAASRNRAVEVASGEWLAPLDADDEWLPQRLEKMLEFADAADAVSDDIFFVERQDRDGMASASGSLLDVKRLRSAAPRKLALYDFVKYDLGLLKPIVRRGFLLDSGVRYDPKYRLAEDFYFYFDLLLHGARWLQISDGYYLYRHGGASISLNLPALARAHADCSSALLGQAVVRDDPRLLAAVRGLNRDWRAVLAYLDVLELVRLRSPLELSTLLVQRPWYMSLIARKAVRHVYLNALRRARARGRSFGVS